MRIGGSSGEAIGEKIPAGAYAGALIGVWDIGRQVGWQDEIVNKIVLGWETSKRDSKGKPFVMYESLKNSSYELAPAAKRFVALAGRALSDEEEEKGFDLDPFIGKSVLLTVIPPKKDAKWPKLETVMGLPEGFPPYVPVGDYKETPGFVVKALARRVGVGVSPQGLTPEEAAIDPEIPF